MSPEPWVVYLAGPLTEGDVEENMALAFEAARHLLSDALEAGIVVVPVVPHTWMFFNSEELEYEDWMEVCLAAVARCDALIRLPGRSPGADAEVAHAEAERVYVFDSIHQFLDHARREAQDGL